MAGSIVVLVDCIFDGKHGVVMGNMVYFLAMLALALTIYASGSHSQV